MLYLLSSRITDNYIPLWLLKYDLPHYIIHIMKMRPSCFQARGQSYHGSFGRGILSFGSLSRAQERAVRGIDWRVGSQRSRGELQVSDNFEASSGDAFEHSSLHEWRCLKKGGGQKDMGEERRGIYRILQLTFFGIPIQEMYKLHLWSFTCSRS